MSADKLNASLRAKPFVAGFEPTAEDAAMFAKLFAGAGRKTVDWAARMASFSAAERAEFAKQQPAAAAAAAPAAKAKAAKEPKAAKAAPAAEAKPAAAEAEAKGQGPPNFLRDLIKKDLAEGGRVAYRNNAEHRKAGDVVRTRFPPEPNGYLHIGHAKSICLNFGLAKEYGGRCHLRFDDTNPASEKQEYIDAIQDDVRWLGFDWGEGKYYASSYFPQLYEWALHLIREGKAYVDSQNKDDMKKNRGTIDKPGTNSPFRTRSVEENLKLFQEMKEGKHPEGSHVLRAKIDMASENMNMRDPPLYRVLHKEHPHTGNEWCIYPIYDFAHGQEDYIEGITHSFCTLEFDAHRPLYNWFLDNLPINQDRRPVQTEFARLNITGTVLSKRKLLFLVDEKIVDGWSDPRMPTICGLRRRGIPPAAIRGFCEKIGVTRNYSKVDQAMFDDVVREELNHSAPRRFAALEPIRVTLRDWPAGKVVELDVANHPTRPELGTRKLSFDGTFFIDQGDFREDPPEDYLRLKPQGEVMLRNVGLIVKAESFTKGADGKVVEIVCTHDPDSKKKLQGIGWVSAADAVKVEVNLYDTLFKEEKEDEAEAEAEAEAEESDDEEKERKGLTQEQKRAKILSSVNLDSRKIVEAAVEPSLGKVQPEERFQFERLGYFVVDRLCDVSKKIVFNRTITLRASGPEKVTNRSRKEEQEKQLARKQMLANLPPQEMFKAQPELYSKFDADGVPTHDAKGEELSKGAVKKLKKEWDKQKKKLEKK